MLLKPNRRFRFFSRILENICVGGENRPMEGVICRKCMVGGGGAAAAVGPVNEIPTNDRHARRTLIEGCFKVKVRVKKLGHNEQERDARRQTPFPRAWRGEGGGGGRLYFKGQEISSK